MSKLRIFEKQRHMKQNDKYIIMLLRVKKQEWK